MIKKRERAIFLGNRLKEYCEEYNSQKKQLSEGNATLNLIGKTITKSHSIQEELQTAP